MRRKLRYLDYWILIPYIILVVLGIIMVYSSSSSMLIAQDLAPTAYFKRQLIFAIAGFILLILVYWLRVQVFYFRPVILFGLAASFILLVILMLMKITNPNSAINGAVGWIPLGPIHIQPVEIVKLTLILYLAYIFGQREHRLRRNNYLQNLVPPTIIALIFIGLIMLQPDVGGASIILAITFVLVLASGIPWIYSLGMLGITGATAVYGVSFLARVSTDALIVKTLGIGYQLARFQALFHPFQLAQNEGIQLVNAYYAINNGGWFGRGLGQSIQKMGYLPEPYTDFILAVIAEELGVVGATVVLLLLGILIVRSFYIGLRVKEAHLTLICYGIGTMLFVQTLFNVGGLLGVLPITGVTLPFISYGGSSLWILSICIGIILNISAYTKSKADRR